MAAKHSPRFVIGSETGSRLVCDCGWRMQMPKVTLEAYRQTPITEPFLLAGFDLGREYERHVNA